MNKTTKIRLLAVILTIIACLLPWESTPLMTIFEGVDIVFEVNSNLGFIAFLLLTLCVFMVVTKEFVKYAHWVSLLPFALFVIDFLLADSEFSEYSGIYIAQIATMVNAVVQWKYRNHTEKP